MSKVNEIDSAYPSGIFPGLTKLEYTQEFIDKCKHIKSRCDCEIVQHELEIKRIEDERVELKQENARLREALEKSEKRILMFMQENTKLLIDNSQMFKALEIYATRTNWSYGESGDDSGDIVFKYNSNDGYYFAKNALEETK